MNVRRCWCRRGSIYTLRRTRRAHRVANKPRSEQGIAVTFVMLLSAQVERHCAMGYSCQEIYTPRLMHAVFEGSHTAMGRVRLVGRTSERECKHLLFFDVALEPHVRLSCLK
ncbi:hypothetical protein DAEQUDRAFT_436947 [Daedalea quercina L-15889]|uniref:Uncharacterized protein n=1 Tax=Daedalea quercina L-15889 TaxID=1314783 RepID=A0A165NAJ4_9APHY|nr:hypothetical protein DAEQUDRAFT_436947 [Daedalea quercina L-15889]